MTVVKRGGQHTYGGYLEWSRPYGDELIDGNHYVREPPSPSVAHQDTAGELYHQIRIALEGKPFRVYITPFDVRLPKATESDVDIDTVVQPDVFIVCDPRKVDHRGVRGAPDWLAEVLSPSTARHDKLVKIPVYERAGVREVWLVDPINRLLDIYRLKDGRYGCPTVVEMTGKTQLAAVPGVSIDWDKPPLKAVSYDL